MNTRSNRGEAKLIWSRNELLPSKLPNSLKWSCPNPAQATLIVVVTGLLWRTVRYAPGLSALGR